MVYEDLVYMKHSNKNKLGALSYTSPPSPNDQMFKDNGFTLLLGGVFFQGVHQERYVSQYNIGILINKTKYLKKDPKP